MLVYTGQGEQRRKCDERQLHLRLQQVRQTVGVEALQLDSQLGVFQARSSEFDDWYECSDAKTGDGGALYSGRNDRCGADELLGASLQRARRAACRRRAVSKVGDGARSFL